ncbi:MAG: hypothetical protein ACPGVO_13065 [Spirulinaceae cyanobacterium]
MAKDKQLQRTGGLNPWLGSVGLLLLVVLGWGAWRLFLAFTQAQRAQDAALSQSLMGPQFQLGELQAIPGTSQVMIPLHGIRVSDRPAYEKSTPTTHNYLFVNSQTNLRNWLLNTNDYLVTEAAVLSAPEPELLSLQTAGILYAVVQFDTDEDQQLTALDQKALALSRPNGQGYRVVMEAVDMLIGHQLTADNTVLVLYEKENAAHSVNIDLDTFRIVEEAELETTESGAEAGDRQ